MSDRRDFLKSSILVAGGWVLGNPKIAFSSVGTFPSGIIYSRETPGRWAKKAGSHSPIVKAEGEEVTITTKHPMFEIHYIVRHTLVSGDGKVLGEKTFFPPSDKKAVSTCQLSKRHSSKLYATSFCNLHDFWVTEFSV